MGKVMSLLGRRAIRPFKEFNLESRVNREITKEKRQAAPWHQSTVKLIEKSIEDQPEDVLRSLKERDDLLLDRLKQVYVTSDDSEPQQKIAENPDRPLPTNRTFVSDMVFGYTEPKCVPYGKITLKDVLQAISKHQEDPEFWTPKKISSEFKLDPGLTEKVLHHFRTFVLIIPKDYKRTQITQETLKNTALTAPITLKQPVSSDNEDESITSKEKS